MPLVTRKFYICQCCDSNFDTLEDAQACAVTHTLEVTSTRCTICGREDPPARCCDLPAMRAHIKELESECMKTTDLLKVSMLKYIIDRAKDNLRRSREAINIVKEAAKKENNNGSN
jgi:hypothetical protein